MSILFIDSFAHYAGTSEAQFARKWTAYQTGTTKVETSSPRRTNSSYLRLLPNAAANNWGWLDGDFAAQQTVCVGMAICFTTTLADHKGIRLRDGAGFACSVYVNADGSVRVYRGYDVIGTQLGSDSATGVISLNTWHYLEFKVYIHDSAGTYEVRIDGVNVLSGSGADTKNSTNATADGITLHGRASGAAGDVDYTDFYIATDFLGDSRVDTLWPSGAGNYSEWTPSAGSNYQNVDDAHEIDDDTTYNGTAVLNEIDSFEYDSLAALVAGHTIDAVAVNLCAKGNIGTQEIQSLIRIATTDYVGTAIVYPNASYDVGQTIWETNPAGGNWLESAINGAEFGYKMVTDEHIPYVTQAVVEVLRDNANPAASSNSVIVAVMA